MTGQAIMAAAGRRTEQKRKGAKAQKCDGHHSFPRTGAEEHSGRVKWRTLRPRETVMIRIRTGLFGVAGLLLSLLPTVAAASVSKPTAEERGACMGDALSLCIAAIPKKARIASCLASKMSQLSPRCRAQFDKAAGRQ